MTHKQEAESMTENTEQIPQHPDGLYFNMPFKTYLAQDRFSNSRITKVNQGALNYWVDEIEPTLADDYDIDAHLEESTEAMTEGKAWHTMALEGVDAFNALYATDYDPADYPKALNSKDEHTKACEVNGVAFLKGDTIAKLQEKLIEAGADVQFHSVLKAEHQAANEGIGLLSSTAMKELQIAGEVMAQYKIQDDFLSDGFPEVTILFTMDGEKYKIRVDWLASNKQVEYKTITRRSKSKPFDEACAAQMHDFSYFSAAYLYSEGVAFARQELGKSHSFAHGLPHTKGATAWLDDLVGGNDEGLSEYWFLFQERGKYNHVLPRRFDKYDEALQARKIQSIWRTGKLAVDRGVKLYNWYMENNGKSKRWLPELNAKAWADEDFKPWELEE